VYRKQVRRRRAAIVALIVISLMLLSLRFGEGEGGPVHGFQRVIASVFTPIGEGAERALKPVRDLVNWFDETFDARGENDELRADLAEARRELAEAESAVGDNEEFRKLLALDREAPVAEYEPQTARVIGRSPTVWYSTVTVDKGSSSGVEVDDPVINGDGLVGRVTDTTSGASQVTLITDHRSAVSATLLPNGPSGIVEPEAGDPDDLLLDFIEEDDEVEEGQTLVTAGWSDGEISSAYPEGLEIGEVSDASEGETEDFQRVHVEPFADMRDLDWVQVLTGGPERPGIPTDR
jgi:rod shape-determining protein MreC